MHDVIFWKDFESLNHLTEVNQSSLFREGPLFLHEFIESSTIAIFVYKVKVVDSLQHVDVPDDVSTVLDGGENVDFIHGAFLKFGNLFKLLGINNLNCYFLFGFHVNGFVNFAIDALAELFEYWVVFDDFAHFWRGRELDSLKWLKIEINLLILAYKTQTQFYLYLKLHLFLSNFRDIVTQSLK